MFPFTTATAKPASRDAAKIEARKKTEWASIKGRFPVYDDVDGLSRLYTADGGSFAVVRNGSEYGRPGFLPLTPRHMQARDWRALYAMDVKKLVIYGRDMGGSLCSACVKDIICAQSGRGSSLGFRCQVSKETLVFKIERKNRGRDKNEDEIKS